MRGAAVNYDASRGRPCDSTAFLFSFIAVLMHVVLVQLWKDARLSWGRSDYDVDFLRVSPDRIWKPDLRLYNALVKILCSAAKNVRHIRIGFRLW